MFYAIYMATRPRGFALVLVPVYFIKHSVSCYIYYVHDEYDLLLSAGGRVGVTMGIQFILKLLQLVDEVLVCQYCGWSHDRVIYSLSFTLYLH